MPIPTPESAIQRAILAVQASESERAASKRFKVPRATLRDRIRGRPTRTESKESVRTLSSAQEEYLKTWAIRQAQLGLAPKHNVFRLFVARLLKTDQPALPLGIHWPLNSRLRRYEQGRGQEVVPSGPRQLNDQQTPIREAPTPTSSRHTRQIEALARNGDVQLDGTHRRLLFRKLGKGLNSLNAQLAGLEQERDRLQAELDKARKPKTRRAVKDPNRAFVTMQDVMAVKDGITGQQHDPQDESGEDEMIQAISSDSESDSNIASCIEVEIR
ncbi:hypothetical protein PG994_007125 [Apiospora phragmitis]|uniref:HTH psq-type domain-containing protein n=1 Tax=Apiospora phragmitis TaxID=2905665 RepID=A0ABR1UZX8_9PEZI